MIPQPEPTPAASPYILIITARYFEAAVAPALRKRFEQCIAHGSGDVRVDLSLVDFIDSAGIGALTSFYRRLAEQGRRMELLGLRGQPLKLIQLFHVDRTIACRI